MMLDWIRPRSASAAELGEQVERASERLAQSRRDVERAVDLFDTDPDSGAVRGLSKARAAEAEAVELLARAERLLAAARTREADEARQTAEARIAEIDRQLARPAVLAAGETLEVRETDLLLQLADVRAERVHLSEHFSALARERYSLQLKLKQIAPSFYGNDFTHRSTLLSADRVVDSLRERLAEIPRDDARHAVLSGIIESTKGAV